MDTKSVDFTTMTAQDLLEAVVTIMQEGIQPVIRCRFPDDKTIYVGFHFVPDPTGMCASCKAKVN